MLAVAQAMIALACEVAGSFEFIYSFFFFVRSLVCSPQYVYGEQECHKQAFLISFDTNQINYKNKHWQGVHIYLCTHRTLPEIQTRGKKENESKNERQSEIEKKWKIRYTCTPTKKKHICMCICVCMPEYVPFLYL